MKTNEIKFSALLFTLIFFASSLIAQAQTTSGTPSIQTEISSAELEKIAKADAAAEGSLVAKSVLEVKKLTTTLTEQIKTLKTQNTEKKRRLRLV